MPREFSMVEKLNLLELTESVTQLLRARREKFLEAKKLVDLLHNIRTPLTSLNCDFALLLHEQSLQLLPQQVTCMIESLSGSISALNQSVGAEFANSTSISSSASISNSDICSGTNSNKYKPFMSPLNSPSSGMAEEDNTVRLFPDTSVQQQLTPRRVRVLLIEDSAMIQKMMRKWLEANNCEVHSALNGQLGLAKLKGGEQFDITITDFLMPVMDGLECLKQFAEWRTSCCCAANNNSVGVAAADESREMLIMGMSATANLEDQAEAFLYGMHSFFVKPVDLHILKLAIDMKSTRASLEDIVSALGNNPEAVSGEKVIVCNNFPSDRFLPPLDTTTPETMRTGERKMISSPLSAKVKKSPKLKPTSANLKSPKSATNADTNQQHQQQGQQLQLQEENVEAKLQHVSTPPSSGRGALHYFNGALNILRRGNSGRVVPQ